MDVEEPQSKMSRSDRKKLLFAYGALSLAAIIGLLVVVWLAWIRPAQQSASINSFEACKAAGYPIQESYPEVCATPDGKRFTNPAQD